MKKMNYIIIFLIISAIVFLASCTVQSSDICVHEYFEVEKLSTCTSGGYSTYKCKFCDDSYTEYVTKSGHNYELIDDTSTCSTDGIITYKCFICGNQRCENRLKSNHMYENGRCIKCNEVEIKQYYISRNNVSRYFNFKHLIRVRVGEMKECRVNENGELHDVVVVRLYFQEGYYSKYNYEDAINNGLNEDRLILKYCEYDNINSQVDFSDSGILKLIIDKSKVDFFTKYDEYLIALNLSSYNLIGEDFKEGKQCNVIDWAFVPDELILPLKDGKVVYNDEVLEEINNLLIEPEYNDILDFNNYIIEKNRLFDGDGYEQISKWFNAVMYMLDNASSKNCYGDIIE